MSHFAILDEPVPTTWGLAHAATPRGVPLLWLHCLRCGRGTAYMHHRISRPTCYPCSVDNHPGPELVYSPDQEALWASYFVGGVAAVDAVGRDRVVSAGADLQDPVPKEP